ncbi:hypothetical protein N0V88_000981 [Collariella sp. IMI 366227]|nr:hypothetical protein N0V88_000981 [Collariella sp. IMI 366227]
MCDFDEFIFTCGHSVFRLKCYCHFARNHPLHHCHRVKKLRSCWDQDRPCDPCIEERQRIEAEMIARARAEYYWYMQQQQQQVRDEAMEEKEE